MAGAAGGHPEISVAVVVEHGLHGSDVAPLAAKAINFYLDRKHGLAFDPQPTLLERWNSRRRAWWAPDDYPAPLIPGRPAQEPSR